MCYSRENRVLKEEGGREDGIGMRGVEGRTCRRRTGKRRKFPCLTSKTPTCFGVASPSTREVATEDPGWEMKKPPARERVGRTRHSCSCLDAEGREGGREGGRNDMSGCFASRENGNQFTFTFPFLPPSLP